MTAVPTERGLRALADALAERLPGRVERDAPLAPFTTYRVGGPAAVLVHARTADDLEVLTGVLEPVRPPLLVVGRGSNLLVAERGFPGVVVVLAGAFERVTFTGATRVDAGGAVALPVLARRSARAGRSGLEFYVGIPGTVGGAVRMNAGGHGRETREVLVHATVADLLGDGRPCDRAVGELDLGYRHSALGPSEVVTAASFAVTPDDPDACAARVEEIVRWRRAHQPGGANAGSVFRNPPGDAAGRLIEACGLKGLRVGGASVSRKHANFIQAGPGATAGDVRSLIRAVQERVAAETGVVLEPEVHLVGFDGEGPVA